MADFGTDILLKDGDLIFTPGADFMSTGDYELNNTPKFSGYYNIIFSVFNRLNTLQGEIPFHPDYGTSLPLLVSKPNTGSMRQSIEVEFTKAILQDPRVSKIISIKVEPQGSQVNVRAELQLIGKSESSVFIFPNFFID